MDIELTKHAKARLAKRKILDNELMDIMTCPDKIVKKQGKYYFQKRLERGKIEVVTEKTENHIKVITIYWV